MTTTWRRRMQRFGDRVAIASYLDGKMHSIKQLPIFPPPTPTRTNATLLVLRMPQLPDRSRWNEDFNGRLLFSHRQPSRYASVGAARMMTTNRIRDGRPWGMKSGGMPPSQSGDRSTSCWRPSFGLLRHDRSG